MKSKLRRPLALTALLVAISMSIGLWPQPTSAVQATVVLSDNNESFGGGRFFRTGLAAANSALNGGGVQLVPVKVDDTWPGGQRLPQQLSSHTSATYGDRLFVVGGNTVNGTQVTKSRKFFATRLADPATGELQPWTSQPALPDLPLALSDMASVVIEVDGQAFLVVMGGIQSLGTLDDVTTSRIFYYPLRADANGYIAVDGTGWREVPLAQGLPHDTFLNEDFGDDRGAGARGVSAVTVKVGSTPYIYIFGGNNRVFNGNTYIDRYESKVWKAPVSRSGDTLNIGVSGCGNTPCWTVAGNISATGPGGGPIALAGAATVTADDPATGSTGVYLIGGTRCTVNCEGDTGGPSFGPDSNAYIARISADGSLTWLETGNMSDTRDSHDAVQSKGRIVVAAGRSGGDPTTTLAQGFIEDSMQLYRSAPAAPNFDLSQGALQGAQARMNHTMETLRGGTRDWAYIIGGRVKVDAKITDASDDVLIGDLDRPPTNSDSFVVNGKYYSKTFDFGDAQYLTLSWKTLLAAGETIRIQYRVADDVATLNNLPWLGDDTPDNLEDAPGYVSVNGNNTRTLPAGTKGRYIQYLATIERSSGAPTTSPVLDAVSAFIDRTGFPNATGASNAFSITPSTIFFGSTITPNLTITNQGFRETNGNVIPALPADWDAPGTFFVDLYAIYVPEGAPQPPKPVFGQTDSQAYVEISKAYLSVGANYIVQSGAWRPTSCSDPSKYPGPECPSRTVNWNSIFNTQGTYQVYVMLDSLDPQSYNSAPAEQQNFGNLKEADVKGSMGESDNILGPFTLTVAEQKPKYYLPYAGVNAPMGVAAQSQSVFVRQPRVHTIDPSR